MEPDHIVIAKYTDLIHELEDVARRLDGKEIDPHAQNIVTQAIKDVTDYAKVHSVDGELRSSTSLKNAASAVIEYDQQRVDVLIPSHTKYSFSVVSPSRIDVGQYIKVDIEGKGFTDVYECAVLSVRSGRRQGDSTEGPFYMMLDVYSRTRYC